MTTRKPAALQDALTVFFQRCCAMQGMLSAEPKRTASPAGEAEKQVGQFSQGNGRT